MKYQDGMYTHARWRFHRAHRSNQVLICLGILWPGLSAGLACVVYAFLLLAGIENPFMAALISIPVAGLVSFWTLEGGM